MENNITRLANPEFIKKMDDLIDQIIENDLIKEGMELVDTIENIFKSNKDIEKKYPEIYKKYKKYLVKAKFIILPNLHRGEIYHLLETELGELFKFPYYDLYNKLRLKILSILDLKERDSFKKQIRDILLKSEDSITKANIKVSGRGERPSVKNWIKDYTVNIGNAPSDKLKLINYFTNSDNFKKLSEDEKRNVKMIFDVYEKFKSSSAAPEGLEESFVAILPDDEINLVYGGELHKINPDILRVYDEIKKTGGIKNTSGMSELDNLKTMAEIYSVGSLERKAIEEEIRKLDRR